MSVQKIRDSFVGLLSSLASGGMITENAKSQFISELDKKLNESTEKTQEELRADFDAAVASAAKQICEEFQGKLDDLDKEVSDQDGNEEDQKNTDEQKEVSIADAFKKFLDCLKEENFTAFNSLTDSFTDEQKELFKKFLDGNFGKCDFCNGQEDGNAETDPEIPAEADELTDDDPEMNREVNEGYEYDIVGVSKDDFEKFIQDAKDLGVKVTQRKADTARFYCRKEDGGDAWKLWNFLKKSVKNFDKFVFGVYEGYIYFDWPNSVNGKYKFIRQEADINEACDIIRSMSEVLAEAGLSEISDGILSEASQSITSLTKKQEREYEKFLKQSIKNLARKNKEMRMTGGVQGGVRRIRNIDEVLEKLRKKLYLSESKVLETEKQLSESSNRIAAVEAENRSLRNQLDDVKSDNKKLINENAQLKKDGKLLNEAVIAAKEEASINEAKAYLTESVSNFSPELRTHLRKLFEGKGIDEVKRNLNEAVEAYRSERREERQQLRKNSTKQMSRIVNEAVEDKVDTDEQDEFVANLAAMSNGLFRK